MGSLLKIFAVFYILVLSSSFSFANSKTLTLDAWKALPAEEREMYAEGYGSDDYTNLKVVTLDLVEGQDLTVIANDAAETFALEMEKIMRTESYLEVEDDYYSKIGSVHISSVTILVLDETLAIGGSISYLQKGCVMPDDSSPYFETEEEAKKAGCDTNADVSWQAHDTFDFDLSPFSLGEYMEWSGH